MSHVESTNTTSSSNERYRQQSLSRLKDWVQYCASEYTIPPELAEMLVTVLIPCYPSRPIWLVVETDRHPFWVHLSYAMEQLKLPHVYNCANLRVSGPRSVSFSSQNIMTWMDRQDVEPRIVVDTQAATRECWRGAHIYHPYWALCERSVRYFGPVQTKRLPTEGAEVELGRLLKLVIDPEHRRVFPKPVELPERVLHLVRWIEDLTKELRQGPSLVENLSLIPGSHAALHGRTELDRQDWHFLSLIVASWVKQWHRKLLQYFYDNVMPYSRGKNQHTAGTSRMSALPDLHLLNDMAWGTVPRANFYRNVRPLEEYGFLETVRLEEYPNPVSPKGVGRKLVSTSKREKMRVGKLYYDLTGAGETLAELCCDPEFDILSWE